MLAQRFGIAHDLVGRTSRETRLFVTFFGDHGFAAVVTCSDCVLPSESFKNLCL
jgi:hypothetical protein